MLTGDIQNGKTKRRQKSRFEGKPRGQLLRFGYINIPIIASSKFLYRFLNPKISNQFSIILIIV